MRVGAFSESPPPPRATISVEWIWIWATTLIQQCDGATDRNYWKNVSPDRCFVRQLLDYDDDNDHSGRAPTTKGYLRSRPTMDLAAD